MKHFSEPTHDQTDNGHVCGRLHLEDRKWQADVRGWSGKTASGRELSTHALAGMTRGDGLSCSESSGALCSLDQKEVGDRRKAQAERIRDGNRRRTHASASGRQPQPSGFSALFRRAMDSIAFKENPTTSVTSWNDKKYIRSFRERRNYRDQSKNTRIVRVQIWCASGNASSQTIRQAPWDLCCTIMKLQRKYMQHAALRARMRTVMRTKRYQLEACTL